MAAKLFIQRTVADFAPGFFQHTVVENGCVQLKRENAFFPEVGTYTCPIFNSEPFFSLIPSWNADTPKGTAIEVQVRVNVGGRWSSWLSFGRWSPYSRGEATAPLQDDTATIDGEFLNLAEGSAPAEAAQMRVLLFSQNPSLTPKVRLLAFSPNVTHQQQQETPAFSRVLNMPSYSCQTREPALAHRIAGATSLTMLINRWGQDLLPEEVARTVYHSPSGRYSNLAFLCAGASAYGFSSHIRYAGISALRTEIWQGRAVAARVYYQAPSLSSEEQTELQHLPVMPGATTTSHGHLVVVCGFTLQEGTEMVVMHDPLAEHNDTAHITLPLATFCEIYTGIALFMSAGPKDAGYARPTRTLARLEIKDNLLYLYEGERQLIPQTEKDETLHPATLCYTLSDGIAYASQAQKTFYYPVQDAEGLVHFELAKAAGRRLTVYFVASAGRCWVAETLLPQLPATTEAPLSS